MEKPKKKYYYYKKKIGRHKKPGPKKKKKMRGRRWQEPWDFKIVICSFRKQIKYVGQYRNLAEVEKEKKKLMEYNNSILFPKKHINNARRSKELLDNLSEFVVLKRVKDNSGTVNQLRNEYGKFVDVATTSDQWMVYDRFPFYEEETFWVYGYNPRTDRKTAQWIIDEMVEPYIADKYSIVQVFLYNNKLIFKYDTETIEFVVCKNVSDGIRLYNLLQSKFPKRRNLVFSGMATRKSEKTNYLFNMIQEKTGWEKTKIYRKTTRA